MITIIHNILFDIFGIKNFMNQQANPVVPTVFYFIHNRNKIYFAFFKIFIAAL